MENKEGFILKVGEIENDVKTLKTKYCNLEERTSKIEENYYKFDKNNALRFQKVDSELEKTQKIATDIKHMLITKEAKEEKEKELKVDKKEFNTTTVIAIISLIATIILGYLALKK